MALQLHRVKCHQIHSHLNGAKEISLRSQKVRVERNQRNGRKLRSARTFCPRPIFKAVAPISALDVGCTSGLDRMLMGYFYTSAVVLLHIIYYRRSLSLETVVATLGNAVNYLGLLPSA